MTKDKVLLVDDEPGLLRSASRVLAPSYAVATASTAREALEKLESFRPDLAVLDIRMPEMDGFQLMSRLRELAPDLDIIFMTGVVHEVDVQLVRAIREKAFYFIQKPFDREVLLTLVERCLELRRLARENRRHVARLEDELEEARRFQASLLPAATATLGGVALAAAYHPCKALGGDFYDHADAGAEGAAFIVADVSGHGVSAAMLTGIVKSAFHDAHADGFAPAAVIERVARALRPFDDDRFVTLFSGRLAGEALEYVNAGHPPPLLAAAGETRRLTLSGPMVSPAFADLSWEVERTELESGARLLCYTDGVTEARGDEGLFGEERLAEVFEQTEARGEALLSHVLAAVRAFAGGRAETDDLTLLTVSR